MLTRTDLRIDKAKRRRLGDAGMILMGMLLAAVLCLMNVRAEQLVQDHPAQLAPATFEQMPAVTPRLIPVNHQQFVPTIQHDRQHINWGELVPAPSATDGAPPRRERPMAANRQQSVSVQQFSKDIWLARRDTCERWKHPESRI